VNRQAVPVMAQSQKPGYATATACQLPVPTAT